MRNTQENSSKKIRLDRFLAEMNAGTRSELKKNIRKGQAAVNGTVIKDPGCLLDGGETVEYQGREYVCERTAYYMLNKPAGVITATKDEKQTTVLELLGEGRRRDLFPVGRLDKDTEGLLLITNDGDLAHRLLSPAHHVNKTYFARTNGALTREDAAAFSEGIVLGEDFTAMPAELEILTSGEQSEARVTIREGKFHQVKRMFAARGKEVVYLKRLAMGPLELDPALRPGEYRKLTETEIEQLKEIR